MALVYKHEGVMKKELAPEARVSKNAHIGHKRRLVGPRGVKIDSQKLLAPSKTIHGCQASS
jgi:hypothetical protein